MDRRRGICKIVLIFFTILSLCHGEIATPPSKNSDGIKGRLLQGFLPESVHSKEAHAAFLPRPFGSKRNMNAPKACQMALK
jgi:hypothetical protein